MLRWYVKSSLSHSRFFALHSLTRSQDLLDMDESPIDSWTLLDGHKHDVKDVSQSYSSDDKVLTPSSSSLSPSSSSSSSSSSAISLRHTSGHPEVTTQGATSSQNSSSITPRASRTPADHGHRHNHKHQEKVCLTENTLRDEHN